MNMTKLKLLKVILAVTLSLGVLSAGELFIQPQKAEAASSYSVSQANRIIATGKKYLGTPYKFGAKTGNTRSFDCSSFTQYIFRQHGIDIPRSSRAQSHAGRYVSKSHLRKGDLVFFYSPIHHVGIYIGNGKVLHTWGKPGVTISDINHGWWKNHYTTARRVIG